MAGPRMTPSSYFPLGSQLKRHPLWVSSSKSSTLSPKAINSSLQPWPLGLSTRQPLCLTFLSYSLGKPPCQSQAGQQLHCPPQARRLATCSSALTGPSVSCPANPTVQTHPLHQGPHSPRPRITQLLHCQANSATLFPAETHQLFQTITCPISPRYHLSTSNPLTPLECES